MKLRRVLACDETNDFRMRAGYGGEPKNAWDICNNAMCDFSLLIPATVNWILK